MMMLKALLCSALHFNLLCEGETKRALIDGSHTTFNFDSHNRFLELRIYKRKHVQPSVHIGGGWMKLLFCVRATKSDSPPIGKFGKRFFFFQSNLIMHPLVVISSLETRAHILNDCSWFNYKKSDWMVIKFLFLTDNSGSFA